MKQSSKNNELKKAVQNTLVAYAAAMLAGVILGVMTAGERISMPAAKILLLIIGNAALFVACYTAVRSIPKRKLIFALSMALGYLLLQCITLLLVAKNGFYADWRLLIPIAVAVISGFAASGKKKRKR